MTSQEVKKWADPAMFTAEEVPQEPEVVLLSCTPDPLGTIAAMAHTYQGKFHKSLAEVTDEERRYYIDDVRKNVLGAPLEFVNFHFVISGVTRAFTHQMVRQRTACYGQESMRFAVKETMPVGRPPSLNGTVPWSEWWEKCGGDLFPILMHAVNDKQRELIDKYAVEQASPQQLWRKRWDECVGTIEETYNFLVNDGMPAEDARGLAPTNTLTKINYTTNLRSLIDHAGLRLCTQAQFEWRQVWVKIVQAIKAYGEEQSYIKNDLNDDLPKELVEVYSQTGQIASAEWQFDIIADLFRPVCYKTGACQFKSDFDRTCSIRDRVDLFSKHGVPSSEWNQDTPIWPKNAPIFDSAVEPDVVIPAIYSGEWLLDVNAARPK